MTRLDANAIADQLDTCRCGPLQDAADDAGERIADLRDEVAQLEARLAEEHLARVNAETERDAAHLEVAALRRCWTCGSVFPEHTCGGVR